MNDNRYVLVEPDKTRLKTFSKLKPLVCYGEQEIADVARQASPKTVWISFHSKSADHFAQSFVHGQEPRGRLLMLKPPRIELLPLLVNVVDKAFGLGPEFRFLRDEEMVEVLNMSEEEAAGRFIGGVIDPRAKLACLIRGNITMAVVPLSMLRPNRVSKADSTRLAFTDYGDTVCLGDYEASADSILYEIDREYREEVNERRPDEELTFGGRLRRARRNMMLTQADFRPLAAKTIARIEHGEIERPHGKTLEVICKRLGLTEEEIETW